MLLWLSLKSGSVAMFPMCVSWTEGPVEIGMSLDIASIDAISEINMVHHSSFYFCHLRDQTREQGSLCVLYLFRTTQRQSSSVSAGVIPDWCSPVMRAWAWTVAWCHCSGSPTLSSQTPSAPSCTMSPWKTASYASSATELFSMLFGTFLCRSFWRSLTADISRCWSQTRRKQIQSTPSCSHVLYKKKGKK